MKAKKKGSGKRGAYTINLGEERTERIATLRAKKFLEGTRISSIESAVLLCVDRQLELERV
jgi:hypothetical protein